MTTYSVKKTIAASADRVWELLTDAAGYPSWNPTIISLEGEIAVGKKIKLVSTVNPKRAFKLNVEEMRPPTRMVWADGMPLGLFKGVRTYTLSPKSDGQTDFEMVEIFSGLLEPIISKSIPDMTESFEEFAQSLKIVAEQE
jgi:hypothetical protein